MFAGIGGFRLGFESVGGFKFAQGIEISATAKSIYCHHFPGTPVWDDVRTFASKPGQFDCIIGGSPCQNLSGCGRKEGLSGEQSSLWWEMLRIIEECRPNFVGWENVEGALHRGAREVAAGLRMVGYEVEGPIIVSAAELGAPHQRKRIFIAAHANHLSLRQREGFACWEEQIGDFLANACKYSHTTGKRRDTRMQQREIGGNELDKLFETSNSRSQGLQRDFAFKESRSERHPAGQPAPVHPSRRNSESPGMGVDDGIPSKLVRVSAHAPWLLGKQRLGWWGQEPAPNKAGLLGKRIAGRRDSISHYGAACIPAQAIPLALRIKFLHALTQH